MKNFLNDDLSSNPFADWLMNPKRKNEMRKRLDTAENSLREKIAKIAYKKGLMEIELQEKLTEQGLDAESIEAICSIYDRMLADQMEKEVV